jgi:hypothetical protein
MALIYNETTGDFDDIPSPPIIRFFKIVESVPFYIGDNITIKWQIDDANHIYIDGEEISGNSKSIRLDCAGRRTIKLKATNADGIAERDIVLNAVKCPTFEINASPTVLHKNRNENVVFRWAVTDASHLRIIKGNNPIEVPLTGELQESPQENQLYVFEATGLEGNRKFEHRISIRVCEVSTVKFKADRLFSYPNLPIKLSWNVTNADSVSLDGIGEQPLIGTLEVTPGTDQTYTLRVNDPFGEHIHTLTIRMLPLPVIKELWVPAPKIDENLAISYNPPQLGLKVKVPTFDSPLIRVNLPKIPALSQSPFYVQLDKKTKKEHWNPIKSLFSYFFDK